MGGVWIFSGITQYQFNSFCLQFDDVDALKITDKKLSKKMLWNKEKKHGLEFKPGLVLVELRSFWLVCRMF